MNPILILLLLSSTVGGRDRYGRMQSGSLSLDDMLDKLQSTVNTLNKLNQIGQMTNRPLQLPGNPAEFTSSEDSGTPAQTQAPQLPADLQGAIEAIKPMLGMSDNNNSSSK